MISTFCNKREYIECDGAKLIEYLQVPTTDSMKFTFNYLYDGEWSVTRCNIEDFDIIFEFFTEEDPNTKFIASKIGDDLINCLINSENASLRVIMANHGLAQGKLLCRVITKYPDPDMTDGLGTSVRVVDPRIALVNNLEVGRWMIDAAKPNNFSIVVRVPYRG